MKFFGLYVFIFIQLLFGKAFGFTLISTGDIHFGDPKVIVNVSSNDCNNIGISKEALLDLVEEAVDDYWGEVSTSALDLEKGGVKDGVDLSADSSSTALSKGNGNTIIIGCTNTIGSSSTLATGSIGNFFDGVRGAVVINDSAATPFSSLDDVQRKATIAHELGHAFGLGHRGDTNAIMFFSIGGKVQEVLTEDDWDGVSYLYPHESPGSCGTVSFADDKGPFGGNGANSFFLMALGVLLAGLLSRFGKSIKSKISI